MLGFLFLFVLKVQCLSSERLWTLTNFHSFGLQTACSSFYVFVYHFWLLQAYKLQADSSLVWFPQLSLCSDHFLVCLSLFLLNDSLKIVLYWSSFFSINSLFWFLYCNFISIIILLSPLFFSFLWQFPFPFVSSHLFNMFNGFIYPLLFLEVWWSCTLFSMPPDAKFTSNCIFNLSYLLFCTLGSISPFASYNFPRSQASIFFPHFHLGGRTL